MKTKSTKTIADDAVFKIPRTILSRKNSDGSVSMIKLEKDKNFYTLDGFAAEVWGMLNGKQTLKQIKQKLIKKHAIIEDRFGKDVDDLIKRLIGLDLISVSKSSMKDK